MRGERLRRVREIPRLSANAPALMYRIMRAGAADLPAVDYTAAGSKDMHRPSTKSQADRGLYYQNRKPTSTDKITFI